MQLIVDSGSTKSDWVLIDGDSLKTFTTVGLNPNFFDVDRIVNVLQENGDLCSFGNEVAQIFFYGAGCSTEPLNAIVKNGLQRIFKKAIIKVDHDIKAATIATCGMEPGISCILGTGSNACFFDGHTTTQITPSLGYVLGDEGSGTYFGKQLLQDYFYNKMPLEIKAKLEATTDISKAAVIQQVYQENRANVFLASFVPFLLENSNNEYVIELILKGFKTFIGIHVCCYPHYKQHKTHFIGSVAYLFQDILVKACDFYGVQIGQIIQKPISGLVDYHRESIQ
ncbi:MAG: N-acetylglucosamine kinase [Putridiphycobacter sp.]|nr:N-acetylglucosamine kinase [Putridiphycobacter sp.]